VAKPSCPFLRPFRYGRVMRRTFAQRIHNPRNRSCGCPPDCWCQRTAIGRTVKWWFPARYFGVHHKPVPPNWTRARASAL
jgi:hypothetical protein